MRDPSAAACASNNGKTAIVRRFLSRHVVPENAAAERATIPVAFVRAPNGPRGTPLLTNIMRALGREPPRRHTIPQLRNETHRTMQDVGLRLLMIDDLYNISGAGTGPILVDLRTMGSATGLSLGCFATKDIAHIFRRDEQKANRFELLTLPRWKLKDLDYASLLRQAAAGAIRTGRECIDLTTPEGVDGTLPARIEAVSLAADL